MPLSNQKAGIIVGIIIGLAIGSAGSYFLLPSGSAEPSYVVSSSGSTTVFPLTNEAWGPKFVTEYTYFTVNAAEGGSGKGQSDIADGLVDIGASSSYPSEEYRTTNTHVKIIPVSADALGIIVNKDVNGTFGLKLDCDMAVAIFQANITTWDAFASTFGVTVVATGDIEVYVRSDASGTTATFAKWLEKADENINANGAEFEWGLGHKESVSWSAGINAVNGNPQIKAGVKGDSRGIGYVGLAFMEDTDILPVPLFNPTTGEYISPSVENALKALPDVLTDPGQNIMNANITGAYPIARLLFYIVNTNSLEWTTLVFLTWCLSKGQQYNEDVGYVPISGTSAMDYALGVVATLTPTS